MKEKRTIRITNSRLRRIRNNLRDVLRLARFSLINDLLDQRVNIQKSSLFWDETYPQYHEMRKQVEELVSRANELNSSFKASIVFRPVCMKN